MSSENGWHEKRVRDLCELGRGRVISTQEIEQHPGIYPVYSSQSSNNGQMGAIDSYDFDGEFVTWTTDGAYAGTVFYRTGKFNCTNVCGTLRARDAIDMQFLAYELGMVAKQHVSYVGNPKLMNGVVADIRLMIPKKAEQSKIAEVLSTADRAIEQTEALIAKQQRIKTGLMQDLLTRGIDEHGNLRSEQTHEFKDSSLGRIPVEWEVQCLGDVSVGGAQNGFFKKPELVGSGFKLVNVSEIYQRFGIDTRLLSVERVRARADDFEKFGVAKGDVFFTRSSLVLTGIAHCNIIRKVHEPTLFECHVMRIRPNRDKIDPEFLALFCQSHTARLYLMSRAKHVTMATISQPELEALRVPVPKRPDEQAKIAANVLASENAIAQSFIELTKLKRLKTALMQDLLTGNRRVTALLEEK